MSDINLASLPQMTDDYHSHYRIFNRSIIQRGKIAFTAGRWLSVVGILGISRDLMSSVHFLISHYFLNNAQILHKIFVLAVNVFYNSILTIFDFYIS